MQNLSFDEGLKSFTINGDGNRVICFNPSDNNIMQRVLESERRIAKFQTELEEIELNPDGSLRQNSEAGAAVLKKFDLVVRKELNYIFNTDVYDIVFGAQSPLCIVGSNKFLFEAFLEAVMPEIEKDVKAASAASKRRIEKYTKEYHK